MRQGPEGHEVCSMTSAEGLEQIPRLHPFLAMGNRVFPERDQAK